MDFVAIKHATDNDLKSFSQTKRWDILSLRSLADGKTAKDSNDRREKKKKLLQLAREIQTSRKKGKHDESNSPTTSEINRFTKRKTCTRKIQIGWMHYNPTI
jgi:DNA phosphorothioation-dependent restriction protein DptG